MSIIPLTVPPKKLAQTISATAMAFKMNNIEGWNGVDLTPADFGTEAFGVFINSTRTQIEIFSFDPATIADPEITIIKRGLGYSGQDVEDAARRFPWASNDTTIQIGTDAPQLFRDFLSESNPATITAQHTYDVLPESAEVPVDDEDLTNKAYVDGLTQPAITVPVNQVAHGFVQGDVIRISGANIYTKAQANSATGSEVAGIVTEVIDVDNFKFITEGIVENASVPAYAAGTVVFLSRTTAGGLVDTDTTTIGEVSAPLGIIIQNGAKMVFHRYRPAVINTISGNPIASETVAGMVEQATPAQVLAKQDVGETGAPLFVVPSLIPDGQADPFANILTDGTMVLDGVNTFPGVLSLAGSDYTLLRSVYSEQLTINGGITLNTDGYLVVAGTIDGAGKIKGVTGNNGSNGTANSGTTPGVGGAGGASSGNGQLKTTPGQTGGNGSNNTSPAVAPAGDALASVLKFFGGPGQNGGTGETWNGSSAGVANNQGIGQPITSTKYAQRVMKFNWETERLLEWSSIASVIANVFMGGVAGGGGGGGSSTAQAGTGGGGAGASGGPILVFARDWNGTFTIESIGGNGGNGGGGTTGGGGAGGNGGCSVFFYVNKTWTGSYVLTGGNAGLAPSGPAQNGTAGLSGTPYEIEVGSLF